MSLHPTEGARYLFELDDAGEAPGQARYRVTVYTPDTETKYTARLSESGEAVIEPTADPLAAALEKNLRSIARTIARAAVKNSAADLPPWPRRVLRWRGPGRGS